MEISSKAAVVPTELPARVTLDVPFASQAPLGNWDMPYQEACEEASMILVNAFLNGTSMTPSQMDREILDVVAWQEANGLPPDITAAEMVMTAQQYFNVNARLIDNPSVDDIKRELAAGNPVIVPLAGRDIGNPYYSGEGPWYHVLVITGYDGSRFLTNDVGTKRGEDYPYRHSVLLDAIHDWTGIKENIREGRRVAVVMEKR